MENYSRFIFVTPPKTNMAMENPHVESEIHLRMMVDFSIVMLFLQGGNDTMSGIRRLCSKSFATTKKNNTPRFFGHPKISPKTNPGIYGCFQK